MEGFQRFNLTELKELPLGKIFFAIFSCFLANQGLQYWEGRELAILDQKISKMNEEAEQIKRESGKYASYEAVQKQVETDTKEVSSKLDTIRKLMSDRNGPVKIVAALSSAIPREVWATKAGAPRNLAPRAPSCEGREKKAGVRRAGSPGTRSEALTS